MFKFSLFQIQYSGSALQKVAGTERIYSTSDPSGNTFDVVSISDLVESLEVEEGIYRIGNLSVTAKGLGATFFHNYNDDLNKPFVFLIRTDSDAVVFHGVIDPQSIKYNAGSQYTVFDVLDWNIFLRKRNVSARSVLEVKFSRPYEPTAVESLTLWLERYTGEDGTIDITAPDAFGNAIVNPGDVIVYESEIGEHRAVIESVGTPVGREVPIQVTNIPNSFSGTSYPATIEFSRNEFKGSIFTVKVVNQSLFDSLADLLDRSANLSSRDRVRATTLRVVVDQQGTNNPSDIWFFATNAVPGNVTLRDFGSIWGHWQGNWQLWYARSMDVFGPPEQSVRFEFRAWEKGRKNSIPDPGGDPFKDFVLSDTGECTVSVYHTTGASEGQTAKILGRGIYGYSPAGVFDRYKVENVIAALYNLSDFGVLKYVVNAVETPPGYNDTLSRSIELPDSPLSAVRLIQNTAYSFLRLVPTLDASGLPQVTVRILPRNRISPSNVGSVTAAVNVLRWTEGGAILPPTAVVVKPHKEYGKPNTKKEYAGWYYAGIDVDENNALTRKLRSVPSGPRVVEIEVNEPPTYFGKEWSGAGTVAVNDYRLKEIAKVYYNYYKDLARDAEFTLVDSRPDLLGKYVTINEVEGGRTVFVDRVGINFSTGQTTVTSRVGEYIAVSTATPTAVISGKSVFTDYNKDGLVDVDLSGLSSFDPLGRALSYQWKVNGVNDQTGPIFRKTLPVGTHTIELTVTSPDGQASTSRSIRVLEQNLGVPAAPDIAIANASVHVRPNGDVVLDWSVNEYVTHLYYEFAKGTTVSPSDAEEPTTSSATLFSGGTTLGSTIVTNILKTESAVIKIAPYNADYGVWGPTVLLTAKGAELDLSNIPDNSIPASAIIDGPGSGLDADYLDSYDSSAFTRKAENATITAEWTFNNNINIPTAALFFGNTTRQMLNLYMTSYGIGVQPNTLYLRTDERFSVFVKGTHTNSENAPGAGGSVPFSVTATHISAYVNIGSPNFTSGFAGAGWRIDAANAEATFQNLTVREQFRVYELLVNKMRSGNGSYVFSDGAKVVAAEAHPEWGTGGYRLYFDPELGVPFAVGDLLRAQEFSGQNVRVSRFRVTWVSSAHVDGFWESGDPPWNGAEFIRVGSATNADRRGLVYISSSDSGAPFVDVVDGIAAHGDWGQVGKIKARLGRLTGITFNGQSLSGYGLYSENVFLKGMIVAESGLIGGANGRWSITSTGIASGQIRIYASNLSAASSGATQSLSIGYWSPAANDPIVRVVGLNGEIAQLYAHPTNGAFFEAVKPGSIDVYAGSLAAVYGPSAGLYGFAILRPGGDVPFTIHQNSARIGPWDFNRDRLEGNGVYFGRYMETLSNQNIAGLFIGSSTAGTRYIKLQTNTSNYIQLHVSPDNIDWGIVARVGGTDRLKITQTGAYFSGEVIANRLVAQLPDGSVMFDSDSRVTDAQNVGRHIGYHSGGKWLSPNNVTVATFYTYVLEGETRISCAFIGSMPTSAHPAAQGRVTLRVEPVRRTVAYDATAGTQFLTGATGTSSAFGNGMSSGSPWLMSGIARVNVSNYQKRLVKITVSVSYVGVSGYDISVRDIVVMAGRDIQGQLTEHAVWDGGALDSKLPRTL